MNTTTEMQLVTIDKLIPYINNARTHSPEQIKKLRASLREFGFINPVIIDKDFNVIAGHGRLLAAKEEGITAKIIIGGAVITQEYADEIGADGYSKDAADAVKLAKSLM